MRMRLGRGITKVALVGLATMAFSSSAKAILILEVVTEGKTFVFRDNVAGQDSDLTPGSISAIVTGANAILVNSQFVSLGAVAFGSSNGAPGPSPVDSLQISGRINSVNGGPVTTTIYSFDDNYNNFAPGAGMVTSSTSATPTAASGSQTFTSFFNPNNDSFTPPPNVAPPQDQATPSSTTPNYNTAGGGSVTGSPNPAVLPVTLTSSFSLSNQLDISFSGSGSTVGFSANTIVTPTAVPEPATLAMAGMAGLVGLVVARKRRK